MALKHFEARVRLASGVAIIDLEGEIDTFAEDALNVAYTEASEHEKAVVVFNFTEVTYINSGGIALIIGLLAEARKAGRRLLTYGLSDHYSQIFRVTRLSDFIGIHPDQASAIAGALEPT